MNPWDILENITLFGLDPKKFIRRTVLVCMILIPSFGGWMINQAVSREQAKAQVVGKVITGVLTNNLSRSLMTVVPIIAPAQTAPMSRYSDSRWPGAIVLK